MERCFDESRESLLYLEGVQDTLGEEEVRRPGQRGRKKELLPRGSRRC